MARVRCPRCRALVTARLSEDGVQVSHGADFLSKCKDIRNTQAADFVASATECDAMQAAIDKVVDRLKLARA
jgi:hypothetical protein